MTESERISYYEGIYQLALLRISELEHAMAKYEAIQPEIAKLEAYYGSDEWKKDFKMDEEGKLPKDLKRGVLSEDGIYDLLEKNADLMEIFLTTE